MHSLAARSLQTSSRWVLSAVGFPASTGTGMGIFRLLTPIGSVHGDDFPSFSSTRNIFSIEFCKGSENISPLLLPVSMRSCSPRGYSSTTPISHEGRKSRVTVRIPNVGYLHPRCLLYGSFVFNSHIAFNFSGFFQLAVNWAYRLPQSTPRILYTMPQTIVKFMYVTSNNPLENSLGKQVMKCSYR